MISAQQIVNAAEGWIGTPYHHQASVRQVGCDCLGLVRGIWRELYGSEPELAPAYSPGWAEAGAGELMAEAARRHMQEIAPRDFAAGDLLLFRWRKDLPAKHAAIAAGGGFMIHAQDGARVCAVDITDFWLKRLAYAFRFPQVRN